MVPTGKDHVYACNTRTRRVFFFCFLFDDMGAFKEGPDGILLSFGGEATALEGREYVYVCVQIIVFLFSFFFFFQSFLSFSVLRLDSFSCGLSSRGDMYGGK